MGDDEVDARVAVPAMPHGETIEPDEPLEHGEPCEQDDLDQREVGTEKTGETARARQLVAGRVRMQVSAVHPEPDDHDGVAHDDGSQQRRADSAQNGGAAGGVDGGLHRRNVWTLREIIVSVSRERAEEHPIIADSPRARSRVFAGSSLR